MLEAVKLISSKKILIVPNMFSSLQYTQQFLDPCHLMSSPKIFCHIDNIQIKLALKNNISTYIMLSQSSGFKKILDNSLSASNFFPSSRRKTFQNIYHYKCLAFLE